MIPYGTCRSLGIGRQRPPTGVTARTFQRRCPDLGRHPVYLPPLYTHSSGQLLCPNRGSFTGHPAKHLGR